MSEYAPDRRMLERMSKYMPHGMPERISEYVPEVCLVAYLESEQMSKMPRWGSLEVK
jgi:hypothetical protein